MPFNVQEMSFSYTNFQQQKKIPTVGGGNPLPHLGHFAPFALAPVDKILAAPLLLDS